MAEIKSLSIRHNEIMDYLMANPMVRLQDVANHFGISGPWLSNVIHSDIFQATLKEKQGIAFHHTVLGVREKLEMVAHQALDRIVETLPYEAEVDKISKVAERCLESLGYGSKPVGPGGNTFNFNGPTQLNGSLRQELEEARALIGRSQAVLPGVIVDGERAPIGLQSENSSRLGGDLQPSAIVSRELTATKVEAAEARD